MPGANRPYTLLDANQTTTQSFDESQDAHRVIPITEDGPITPVNPLPVFTNALPFPWDYVSLALSNGDARETYTFKTGGSAGANTGTVVINYTSSSRDLLVDVTIAAM